MGRLYSVLPEYADKWFRGEGYPMTIDEIRGLAQEWGCTLAELMDEVEPA